MTNYDTAICKSLRTTVSIQLAFEIREVSCVNLLLIKYFLTTFNREFILKIRRHMSKIIFFIFSGEILFLQNT